MKTDKKLIAYSVIALLIGIASITPLIFLMTAKAETTPKPWFNLDVPYAFLKANFTENLDGRDIYSDLHSIVLNFTLNPEAENEIFDARFEYFELQVYTDKEPVWNSSYFVGSNRTNSFTFEADAFHFMREGWFDSNTTGSGGGMFAYQWNASGTADISTMSGISTYSSATGHTNAPREFTALKDAEIVYIDVRRVGLVTFDGNSTMVTLSDDAVIQHIELQKFGEGFLYNTLFSEDQLSQIDPFMPLRTLLDET